MAHLQMGTSNTGLTVRTAIYILIFLAGAMPALSFNEEEAANQWTAAYIWLQTGRNLSESGQAPLAYGSFVEALQQFEKVAEDFPDFETKMVNYRIDAIKKDLGKIKEGLSPEDQLIATEYIEFIQLIKQADEQRYSAQREAALETMRKARASLDAIVARRPTEFAAAVKSQHDRLSDSIDWLDHLYGHREVVSKFTVAVSGNLIKGTTEFISEGDLPATPGLKSSGKSLFPGK